MPWTRVALALAAGLVSGGCGGAGEGAAIDAGPADGGAVADAGAGSESESESEGEGGGGPPLTCFGIITCGQGCTPGDEVCIQACLARGCEPARAAYAELLRCVTRHCRAECSLPAAPDGGMPTGVPSGMGACEPCGRRHCGALGKACTAGAC